MTDWSAAGKKAWVTRRANARFRKRSASAKKAWESRRNGKSTQPNVTIGEAVRIRILTRDETGFTAIIEPLNSNPVTDELAARRSAAAHKAWDTRRKNAASS